ncbi:MFS transporter [Amycolatopsis anabasis]|uniref:MFS transporter n=1 Tax=Amycolatopsis anabasis TaxID=1840409 RepID=UPI00131B7AE9|nr:MFS transporter [Amycolatopsis anabasis]
MAIPNTREQEKSNLRSVVAGIYLTFVTNVDYLIIATLLPVAVIGGRTVAAAEFSLALSIRLTVAMVVTSATPALLARLGNAGRLLLAAIFNLAGFLALFVTTAAPGLYVFAVLGGMGAGVVRPTLRTLLADAAAPAHRSKVFQVFFVAMNAAFVLGPVISRGVVSFGWARAFLVIVAVAELTAGLAVVLTSKAAPPVRAERVRTRLRDGLLVCVRPPVLPVLVYAFGIYFGMDFMMTSFLLYDHVVPGLAGYREFFLSLEPLAALVLELCLLPVFARLGRPGVYAMVATACGAGVFLAFSASFWLVFSGIVLFAFAESLALPQNQLDATAAAPAGRQASVFSALVIAGCFGEIFGTMTAGYLVRAGGTSLPAAATSAQFLAVGMAVCFGAAGFVLLRHGRRNALSPVSEGAGAP